jgi:thiol-disulfide isomerase/thioredoxin
LLKNSKQTILLIYTPLFTQYFKYICQQFPIKKMKRYLLLLFITAHSIGAKAQGYNISLQSNHKTGIAYLTYYMGKDFILQDSAAVNNTGKAVFKNKTALQSGIYSIIFPGKRLSLDFLVDKEQKINIVADTNNISKAVITGSSANVLFKAYQAEVNNKGKGLNAAKKLYDKATTKQDSLKYELQYKKLNNELNNYRESIIKTKPTSMMAALLNALREPAYPTKIPVTRNDSIDNYNFYKSHYWDGVTFMDDRIIRTPFFLPKLQTYYRQVMPQAADSIKEDIDYKLLLARNNPEMFKYLLNWFTDEYINPKYMGQDAIFVHLFERYHSQKMSPWLNKAQDSIITRTAMMLMSNLIGERAANVTFTDTTGKKVNLYDVNGDFTLLVFWEPNCGHCKEELPRIDSFYRARWQQKNVKIFAVLSETEKIKDTWLAFLREKKIGDWVNVYQTAADAEAEQKSNSPSYRQLFNVIQTPTLFLLDKEKRIIAKKLSLEQVDDFIDVMIKKGENK